MIAAHNTMTYLKAKSFLWEKLSCWWRCQDKTIDEQIASGVRFFDLRVVYDAAARDSFWSFAHGYVTLKPTISLREVLLKIQECNGKCRVTLEKGGEDDEELFADYFNPVSETGKWPCIVQVIIKKGWRVLWNKIPEVGMTECFYAPYHRAEPIKKQLKAIIGFPWKSLKKRAEKWAKPNRVQIGAPNRIWWYDFI